MPWNQEPISLRISHASRPAGFVRGRYPRFVRCHWDPPKCNPHTDAMFSSSASNENSHKFVAGSCEFEEAFSEMYFSGSLAVCWFFWCSASKVLHPWWWWIWWTLPRDLAWKADTGAELVPALEDCILLLFFACFFPQFLNSCKAWLRQDVLYVNVQSMMEF